MSKFTEIETKLMSPNNIILTIKMRMARMPERNSSSLFLARMSSSIANKYQFRVPCLGLASRVRASSRKNYSSKPYSTMVSRLQLARAQELLSCIYEHPTNHRSTSTIEAQNFQTVHEFSEGAGKLLINHLNPLEPPQ
jgi:hypothetical protein